MTIELHFDDSQVKQLLNAVVRNMTNPQPVLHEIGQLVRDGIADNFEEGGAYSSPDTIIGGSKKWQPLSPVTKKIKARQGKKGPYQILVDSARLRDSITSKAAVASGTTFPEIASATLTDPIAVGTLTPDIYMIGRTASPLKPLSRVFKHRHLTAAIW